MKASLVLLSSALAFPTIECRGRRVLSQRNKASKSRASRSTLSLDLSPDLTSTKPTETPTSLPSFAPNVLSPTEPALSQAIHLPSSALFSKMSPTLLHMRRSPLMEAPLSPAASAETYSPTHHPSSLASEFSPTSGPVPRRFSFTPPQSEDSIMMQTSDTEIRCTFTDENMESYQSVELPYYYQLSCGECVSARLENAPYSSVERILRMVESSLLNDIATMLSCTDEKDRGENIRRSLASVAAIAAYSLPDDTISNEYTCSDPKAQSCHIVEGKITLIVHGGADEVMSEAYARVKLAFLTLQHDTNTDKVSIEYIGSDPLSLSSIDKLSKRADMGAAEKSPAIALPALIFLIVSGFGTVCSIMALVAYLRSTTHKDDKRPINHDKSEVESAGVPSSICITTSSSSDGAGEVSHNLDVGDEECADWCRLVYLQSLALLKSVLTRVPEDSSVSWDSSTPL